MRSNPQTPLTCGRTSAILNATVRPGSSVVRLTGCVLSVTTLTWGGWGAGACFLWPHATSARLSPANTAIWAVRQILALHALHRRKDIRLPFRMWLYPVPSVVAFLGWAYIFLTSGWRFAGFGIVSMIGGIIAYSVWMGRAGYRVTN